MESNWTRFCTANAEAFTWSCHCKTVMLMVAVMPELVDRHQRSSTLFTGQMGGMPTSNEGVVRRWREYSKDLFNLTEETEQEDLEVGPHITGTEVAALNT